MKSERLLPEKRERGKTKTKTKMKMKMKKRSIEEAGGRSEE